MGVGSSLDPRKPVRGGIHIQTEKTGYISGETITGVLHVNLEENYQGHILLIKLEGYEETHWTYRSDGEMSGMQGRRNRQVSVKGLHRFLDYSIPVYDFALGSNEPGYTMQPGQWTIPFSLVTASSLPSAMKFSQNNQTSCAIKYRINASIISTEISVRPVEGIQDIFIAQQVNAVDTDLNKTYLFDMNTACCCARQQLSIKGSLDKACYVPGETIKVTVDCDMRNVKFKADSISLEFFGNLTMKSNISSQTKTMSVFAQEKIIEPKGETISEVVEIVIPQDISLNAAGSLIDLAYKLRIKPSLVGCCPCQSNDHSENFIFPIIINPTSQTLNSIELPPFCVVTKPQNWNPTQLEQTQFTAQQAALIQQQQAKFPAKFSMEVNQKNASSPLMETDQKLETYL